MDSNIVVVFDEVTRSNISISVTDLIYKDVKVISKISDIPRDFIDSGKCVVFLMEWFFTTPYHYSTVKMLSRSYHIKFIYLGLNSTWLQIAKTICTAYKLDCASLDYDLVSSIVYEDKNLLDKLQHTFKVDDTITKTASSLMRDAKTSENVKKVCSELIVRTQVLEDLTGVQQSLLSELANISAVMDFYRKRTSMLYSNYLDIIRESKRVDSVFKQYEVAIQKDFYDKVDITKYSTRPSILYFKEYEELLYLMSFIDTVYHSILLQNKAPVKVLLLFDSSASKRLIRVPTKYTILKDNYSKAAILESDFLIKIGNYDKILDILLSNQIKIEYLIIVDMKDHSDTVISGNFVKFNMCRNLNDCELYSIEPSNTICNNNPNHELSWDYYQEYSKLSDDSDRFLFLSSRPAIQYIHEILNMYKDMI